MLECVHRLRQCFASVMQKHSAAATALKPRALFAVDVATQTFEGHAIDKQDDGTSILREVEIFKSGTFRDSWGDQQTWTPENLFQMVSNFNALRDSGLFPNVPVRRDHSNSVDKIMGYFDSMRTDGTKLFGDLHITESSQITKLTRGTYRSRSLELGMYESNDGAMYWPVVFGVAYVDIPAVEGLHNKDIKVSYFSQTSDPKETFVTTTANTSTIPSSFTLNIGGTTVPADAGATKPVEQTAGGGAGIPTVRTTVVAGDDPRFNRPATKFRINGADVEDPAAVQRHIDTLEVFAKDSRDNARKSFVAALAKDQKIVAPLEAGLAALAVSMTDEQFAEFTKAYDAAPTLSLLADHGGQQTQGTSEQTDAIADRKSVLEETILMHRRARMDESKIQQTRAFKELASLNSTTS